MVSYERYELKSGDTRWRAWYRSPDHRRKNKSGFKTKRDAQEWAARNVTVAISDGMYVDPQGGKTLIAPLGDEWVASHENVWKPSYLHSVDTSWRAHVKPKWGGRQLKDITHSEVQAWVSALSREKSASVVHRAFTILKGIYDTARKDGRIARTPVEDIQLPRKTPKRRVYLTPEQLSRLADCSGVYRPLILTLGLCGLRWGEATALTVKDIDFRKNRISVNKSVTKVGGRYEVGTPKSGKARDVPMFPPVAKALRETVEGKSPDDLVFTGEDGGYVAPQTTGKGHRCWYKTALEKSGVPVLTCHDLRHTAASIAVSCGANVKALQRMLGHASAAMTLDTYADLFDDDLDVLAGRVGDAIADVFNENETGSL